jgi:hypothetical protein
VKIENRVTLLFLPYRHIWREGKTAQAARAKGLRELMMKKEKMMGFSGTNLIMPAITEKSAGMSGKAARALALRDSMAKKGENLMIRVRCNLIRPETAFRDAYRGVTPFYLTSVQKSGKALPVFWKTGNSPATPGFTRFSFLTLRFTIVRLCVRFRPEIVIIYCVNTGLYKSCRRAE